MLCAVDYIFNLLCAINSFQPMKKFVFAVASRATGRLQIKPSGSGDENEQQQEVRLRSDSTRWSLPSLPQPIFVHGNVELTFSFLLVLRLSLHAAYYDQK